MVAGLALTCSSSADAFTIKVKNDTKQDLGVIPNGDPFGGWCRQNAPTGGYNLYTGMPGNKVAPNSTREFTVGRTCVIRAGYQSISIVFQDAGGNWLDPFKYGSDLPPGGASASSTPLISGAPKFFAFLGVEPQPLTLAGLGEFTKPILWGIPSGWFPMNPRQLGKAPITGGSGLYCVFESSGGKLEFSITVTSDASKCNARRPIGVIPGETPIFNRAPNEQTPRAEEEELTDDRRLRHGQVSLRGGDVVRGQARN